MRSWLVVFLEVTFCLVMFGMDKILIGCVWFCFIQTKQNHTKTHPDQRDLLDRTERNTTNQDLIPTVEPLCYGFVGMPLTVRSCFIIDPNKIVKLIITYPASTGELRRLHSWQDFVCSWPKIVWILLPHRFLRLCCVGRNFHEILRVIDSLQLTAYKKVKNWNRCQPLLPFEFAGMRWL